MTKILFECVPSPFCKLIAIQIHNKFFETVNTPNNGLCKFALDTLSELGNILTLFQSKKDKADDSLENVKKIVLKYSKKADGNLKELVDLLLKLREEARTKKDWNTADGIRNDLDNIGFEIQDTDNGPVWRKK